MILQDCKDSAFVISQDYKDSTMWPYKTADHAILSYKT